VGVDLSEIIEPLLFSCGKRIKMKQTNKQMFLTISWKRLGIVEQSFMMFGDQNFIL